MTATVDISVNSPMIAVESVWSAPDAAVSRSRDEDAP